MPDTLAAELDPSQVLDNPIHEKFARLRASGTTQADAYKAAYGVTNDRDAHANASRLVTANDMIRARIRHLQGEFVPSETLSRAEKLSLCAQFARADLGGEQRQLLRIASKVKYDRETGAIVEIATPDKLRAIELHAKIDGDLAGEQPGVTMINIDLRRQLLGRDAEPALEVESMAGNGQAERAMCPKLAGSEPVASGEGPTE